MKKYLALVQLRTAKQGLSSFLMFSSLKEGEKWKSIWKASTNCT